MRGILGDTWAEMRDRKVIYIYAVATAIGLLFLLLARSAEMQLTMEGGDMGAVLSSPIIYGLNQFLWLMVFVSVMVSAPLIPHMLSRGRVDFYFSKPLSREAIILRKIFAVWALYGGLCVAASLLLWVVAGVFFQTLNPGYLWLVVVNLLSLAIWLSVICLVGVAARSTGHSILAAFGVWLAQAAFRNHEAISAVLGLDTGRHFLAALYYIFPKSGQITDTALQLALDGSAELMPLWTSALFGIVLLVATARLIKSREY